MSRELPPERQQEPDEPPVAGRVHPTGPGPLVVIAVIGLFLGWVLRSQSLRANTETPSVSWLIVGVTWFVAAIVAGITYLTWRTVHHERRRLTAQQGLNRLVLGKTMARLGAFAFGAFLGSAISRLGVDGEGARDALIRALAAAIGAGVALAAGLLLEHACRVPPEQP